MSSSSWKLLLSTRSRKPWTGKKKKKKRGFQGQEEEGRRAGRERGREDGKSEQSLLLGGEQGQRNKEAES